MIKFSNYSLIIENNPEKFDEVTNMEKTKNLNKNVKVMDKSVLLAQAMRFCKPV